MLDEVMKGWGQGSMVVVKVRGDSHHSHSESVHTHTDSIPAASFFKVLSFFFKVGVSELALLLQMITIHTWEKCAITHTHRLRAHTHTHISTYMREQLKFTLQSPSHPAEFSIYEWLTHSFTRTHSPAEAFYSEQIEFLKKKLTNPENAAVVGLYMRAELKTG